MTGKRRKPDPIEPPGEIRDDHEHAREKRVEYLTARQLAEVLQISEATVHRLRRARKIPAVELTGRLIRFNLRDVQKALRALHAQSQEDETAEPAGDEPTPQLSFDEFVTGFSEPSDNKLGAENRRPPSRR